VPGHLYVERKPADGIDYVFKEYIANTMPPDARSAGNHFKVLKPTLLPSKESTDLWELRFALNRNVDVGLEHLIRYWIETNEFRIEQKIPMSSVVSS
jgi:hypothetical protein